MSAVNATGFNQQLQTRPVGRVAELGWAALRTSNMILREFITKALSDIIGAVEDVEKASPGTVITSGVSTTPEFVQLGVTHLQSVDFEVTVRADEQSGSEAKLSVVAAVIGGKVKGESGKSGGHSATLRFRVPIRLSTIPRG